MLRYLAALRWQRIVLWCYLCWYFAIIALYLDTSPLLWLSSVGISAIIGAALLLSITRPGGARPDRWTVFRLFLMPFCVSSYSAIIKGRGFVLIFPPDARANLIALASCLLFITLCLVCRRLAGDGPTRTP